jgi:hypothetical protein
MKPIKEIIKNLTDKHTSQVEKAKKAAENQIKAAQAAMEAAQKMKSGEA